MSKFDRQSDKIYWELFKPKANPNNCGLELTAKFRNEFKAYNQKISDSAI